jgi:hypothetical protein
MDVMHYEELASLQKLGALITGENISVVFGAKACTNGKRISVVPRKGPLDQKAKLHYLGQFIHEVGHIYGDSDFVKYGELGKEKHGELKHKLVNFMDDIRTEVNFDGGHSRSAMIRAPYYEQVIEEINPFLKNITRAKDGVMGVTQICCSLMLLKARMKQLGINKEVTVQPEMIDLHNKYFKKFQGRVLKQTDYMSSENLGRDIYKAIRDLIKDEIQPPGPGKEPPKKKEDEDEQQGENGTDGTPSGNDGENSSDAEGKDTNDSDDKEPGDGAGDGSGDSPDSEDDSDPEGDGSESQPNKDPVDDEGDTGSSGGGDAGADDNEQGGDQDSDGDNDGEGDPSEDDTDNGDPDLDRSPVDEKEIDKRINKELQDDKQEIIIPLNDYIKALTELEFANSGEYLKDPNVVDDIHDGYEGTDSEGMQYRTEGLKLVGQTGADIFRLFIQQTKPRILRRQERGRFDVRRFEQTPYSSDIYASKIPGALDMAALSIGLDNSGSMNNGNKTVVANRLLSGLLYHADRSSVPTEAAGYTIDGTPYGAMRDIPVRIDVIKRFEEHYDAKIMRRCTPLPSSYMGNTPDMDVLTEFLVPRLMARPEKKKVIFMICDGCPTNLCGRLCDSYKRYVKSLKEIGIIVWGFGIESDLSYYFDDTWSMVTANNLAGTVVNQLQKIFLERM